MEEKTNQHSHILSEKQQDEGDGISRTRLGRSSYRSFFSRRLMKKLKIGIFILVFVLLIVGGIFLFSSSRHSNSPQSTAITPTSVPSSIPTDTPQLSISPTLVETHSTRSTQQTNLTPTVDCVGPDGKHLFITQQQCTAFDNAWATPTLTPTSSPSLTSTPTITPTPSLTIIPTNTPTPPLTVTPTPGS